MEVKLQDDDATNYTSNHEVAFWSILRNGPAATTVELPAGTQPADIASISVRRFPLVGAPDDSVTLTVTELDRAFFLRGTTSRVRRSRAGMESRSRSPPRRLPR